MNILVVGFGNMGCRHTQSLLSRAQKDKIWVSEPSDEIFRNNSKKINANAGDISHVKRLEEIQAQIDFAIVATTSSPRFRIMKSLLANNIKSFLVEKVVFQSSRQFEEIIRLLELHRAKAYCNFVNRYFVNYQNIKKSLKGTPLSMIVSGGDFGLACNALHYVDLFEYLTEKSSHICSCSLKRNEKLNKRGDAFKEVLGQLVWETKNGDQLFISADENRSEGNEIVIVQNGAIDVLNEKALRHIRYSTDLKVSTTDFTIRYTSELTSQLVQDIAEGKSALPTIQDTMSSHVQLFAVVNKTLKIGIDDVCPIT